MGGLLLTGLTPASLMINNILEEFLLVFFGFIFNITSEIVKCFTNMESNAILTLHFEGLLVNKIHTFLINRICV